MSGVARFRRRKMTDAEKGAAFFAAHPLIPTAQLLQERMWRPLRVWQAATRVKLARCWFSGAYEQSRF